MVIVPMEADKKMHNSFFKYLLFIGIIFFSSFILPAHATNYGSGLYNSGLYSTIVPIIGILPNPGTYNSTQSVSLTAQGSSLIRYSTLSVPVDCTTDTLYSSPISVSVSTRIYVRACDIYGNSSVGIFGFTITNTIFNSPSGGGGGSSFTQVTPIKEIVVNNGNTCQSGELFNTKNGLPCPANNIKVIVPNNSTNLNNSSSVLFTKNLKYKMSGLDVRLLQIYLNNHGYLISKTGPGSPGKETIYFGLSTKKSVTYFQKKNNIKADGIFGSNTRKLINSLK